MADIKQSIISEAISKLASLGVPATSGQGADIVISATFVDARWSTGKKKITFDASILLDEAARTALMWQKTSEASAGFSFGFSSQSYRQQGATLFRKVKATQYGPDGKAYEYELDLGEITRAVEDAAKARGWQFKTVLKRAEASYPPGYSPAAPRASFCPSCGEALTGNFCGKCGRRAGAN